MARSTRNYRLQSSVHLDGGGWSSNEFAQTVSGPMGWGPVAGIDGVLTIYVDSGSMLQYFRVEVEEQ